MSQQEAKRFLEALEADQKLMEEVRAKAADSQSTAEFYAAAAKDLGFDFDALELEAELKARQDALMDGVELDDTELEQVAGGNGEWCWWDNLCMKAIRYQKEHPNCRSTYMKGELFHCQVLDYCSRLVHRYE